MADLPRIDELRRRVRQDPASISFAALAEEYRRAGQYQEAIDVCREGLRHHPGYLSARVTLGRALLEVGDLLEASGELEHVLTVAPENLLATRTLEEIHRRNGVKLTPAPEPAPAKVATREIPRIAVSQAPPAVDVEVSEARTSDAQIPETQNAENQAGDLHSLSRQSMDEQQTDVLTADLQATDVDDAHVLMADTLNHDTQVVAADEHVHATAEEPALAGLEEFLEAILRARRETDHNHEPRR
jgi:tetratricopeptide (TPR) repeat protein